MNSEMGLTFQINVLCAVPPVIGVKKKIPTHNSMNCLHFNWKKRSDWFSLHSTEGGGQSLSVTLIFQNMIWILLFLW